MSAQQDYMVRIRAFLDDGPRWSDAVDPRDRPRKAVRFVPDSIQRRDIVATLRNAVPDIDAVAGLRAARTLGALRNDPFYRDAVAAHLATPSDGTMYPFPALPESFTARRHESRVTRSRKGRTSFKVDRRGIAQVIGSTSTVTAPYPSDEVDTVERGWLSAHLSTIPRKCDGRSSLAVLRVTDYRLARYGVDALLGTDLTAWASVVDADVSDRSACAIQRCLITAGESDGVLDRFTVSDAPTSSRRVARFALSRPRLRMPTARLNDPSVKVYTRTNAEGKEIRRARFVPTVDVALATAGGAWHAEGLGYGRCLVKRYRYVAPCDRPAARVDVDRGETITLPATHRGYWQRGEWHSHEVMPERAVTRPAVHTALGTATADHIYVGHALVERGKVAASGRSTRDTASAERTAARCVGTVDAPSIGIAWETLCDGVNRGEYVAVRYPDGLTRRLSRGTDGRYALTLPDGSRVRGTRETIGTRAA